MAREASRARGRRGGGVRRSIRRGREPVWLDRHDPLHERAGGAAFYGVVKSDKRACRRHRAVNLQQSASRDSGYSTIGSGNTTNLDHTWGYAPDPFSAGWYRAVAPPKQLAKGVCRKAKSPPLGIF